LRKRRGIQLRIGEGGRYVDLVREGVDCVLPVGKPTDSSMIGRQIALLQEGTFASPGYLAQHGTPHTPDDLGAHRMIGFVSSATGGVLPLEFQVNSTIGHNAHNHPFGVAEPSPALPTEPLPANYETPCNR
jgi:DNA-binding transcriptional LysR family regulator